MKKYFYFLLIFLLAIFTLLFFPYVVCPVSEYMFGGVPLQCSADGLLVLVKDEVAKLKEQALLSYTGNTLTLQNGQVVDIPLSGDVVKQVIERLKSQNLLNDGIGLVLNGKNLSLVGNTNGKGGVVDLSALTEDPIPQTAQLLSINGNTITLSNGNSITLPSNEPTLQENLTKLTVSGGTTLNNLGVVGASTFNSIVTNGTVSLNGPVNINNSLTTTGPNILNGSTTISNLNVTGNSNFNGQVVFNSLPVIPLTEGSLFVGNSLNVGTELPAGNAGDILVIQNGVPAWTNLASLVLTGELFKISDGSTSDPIKGGEVLTYKVGPSNNLTVLVNGTNTVTYDIVTNPSFTDLTVSGNSTINNLTTNGNILNNGTVTNNGNTILNTLNVGGASTLNSINTSGPNVFGGNTTIENLTTNGTVVNNGEVTFNGATNINGVINLSSTALTSLTNTINSISNSINLAGDVTGTLGATVLGTNTVDSSNIVDGSIISTDLGVGSVTLTNLANCSLDGHILKYYAVDPDGVGALVAGWNCDTDSAGLNSITSAMIIDGTITSSDISTGGVTTINILDGTISLADLAANSVDSSKIVDGTVSLADLAANSVDSSKIVDGSVSTADLANGSVTLSKLANCSLDGHILKYYVVDPDGVGALVAGWNCDTDSAGLNSITSAMIIDGTITSSDISTGGVTTINILDGTISLADLAANSVDSSKIVDGTVSLADLAANSVDSSKIVDGSVSTADLANGSVTLSKLANCVLDNHILKYFTIDPDGGLGPLTVGWNCIVDVGTSAVNGLNMVGTTAYLGGPLIQNTNITSSGFDLNIVGSTTTTTLDSAGYVGIGNTAPQTLLHTTLNTSDALLSSFGYTNTAAFYENLQAASVGTLYRTTSTGGAERNTAMGLQPNVYGGNGSFEIAVGSNGLMTTRIAADTTTGNWVVGSGFGSANAPGSKLSVLGNLAVGRNYQDDAAPFSGAIIEGTTGIGTLAPTNKLHVNGTNPLRLEGLQAGVLTDTILTADATGVVRQLSMNSLLGATGTKVAVFAGDIDVQGQIDPNSIAFSTGLTGTYNAGAFNGYWIGPSSAAEQRPIFVAPSVDTTRAFEVRRANFTQTVFDVDTLNERVGIGTNSPVERFHVAMSPNQKVQFGNTTNGGFTYEHNSGNVSIGGDNGQNGDLLIKNIAGVIGTKLSVDGTDSYIQNGKFGIGVTTPTASLDVLGRSRMRSNAGITAGMGLLNLANTVEIGFMGAIDDSHIGFFSNGGAASGLVMNVATGHVGIGTGASNPTRRLTVKNDADNLVATFIQGTSICTINVLVGLTCTSDERLKENITPLGDGLAVVGKLKPVSYNWNNNEDTGKYFGFIAQEVQEVVPEAVSEDPTSGYLTLSNIELLPYVVKSIQEIDQKISALTPSGQVAKLEYDLANDEAFKNLENQVSDISEDVEKLKAEYEVFISTLNTDIKEQTEKIVAEYFKSNNIAYLLTGDNEVTSINVKKDLVVGNTLVVNGNTTLKGSVKVSGEVEFEQEITVSNNTAGTVIVDKASSRVKVLYSRPKVGNPIVTVTPRDVEEGLSVSFSVVGSDRLGFEIQIETSKVPLNDYKFNWVSLSVK